MSLAYHKLKCTGCRKEMVISFNTLQMVVPHHLLRKPDNKDDEDDFYLWEGHYCFQCNVRKIGNEFLRRRESGIKDMYSEPKGWEPPEIKSD